MVVVPDEVSTIARCLCAPIRALPQPEANWDRIVTTCQFEEPDRVPLTDIVTPGLQKKLTAGSGGTGYGLGETRGGSFGRLDEASLRCRR